MNNLTKTLSKDNLYILYGEDSVADAALFKKALQSAEFSMDHVVHLRYGEEIVSYLKNVIEKKDILPDIVVTDLTMPFTSGLSILTFIRNTPELKHLPVVLLTGSDFAGDRLDFDSLGGNRYLVKDGTAYGITSTLTEFIESGKI